MTPSALAHVGSYLVIIAGLLVPTVSYAANSNSPYDQSGTNPAQSNCDSRTGCANYSTGDRSHATPARSSSRASRAQRTASPPSSINSNSAAGIASKCQHRSVKGSDWSSRIVPVEGVGPSVHAAKRARCVTRRRAWP